MIGLQEANMGYFKEGRTLQHSTAALWPVCVACLGSASGLWLWARELELERGAVETGLGGAGPGGWRFLFRKKIVAKSWPTGGTTVQAYTVCMLREIPQTTALKKKRLLVRHIVVALMALPSSSESCPQLRPFFAFPFELFLDVLLARVKFCSFTFTVRESLPSRLTTTRPAVSSK